MKRTTIRRRRKADPVTPETRESVLLRDRECVLAKRNRMHVCHDQWGRWHASDDLHRLSLEHVKDELRSGKRAASDLRHLVALCYGANLAVPSKDERTWMRDYLRLVAA